MKTRVAIVDDNTFLIRSIQEKLSFFEGLDIRFTADNGIACLEKLNQDPGTDLILMDIEMPKMNGIEACSLLKKNHPRIKVIMLTVFDNDENIFKAIQAGADGYLLKEVSPPDLYNAIIQTMGGGASMTPSIAMKTLRLLRNPIDIIDRNEQDSVKLSSREIEVLEHLSAGISHTRIAEKLFLSPGTVRKHIENIYKKLNVHSKIEAVQKARLNRLI